MMTRIAISLGAAIAGVSISSAAFAHTGIGAASGVAAGFAHPLAGLDHMLAMVGVGLFAWMLKGRALWLVPAAFVGMMVVGGLLGFAQAPVPLVELGIGLSVVALGAAIAFGRSLPVAGAMAIVGAFAIFHGHAHGAEMPATVSGIGYGAGFVAATVLLHGAGLLAGYGFARLGDARGLPVARAGGAAMAVAGLAIVGGVF